MTELATQLTLDQRIAQLEAKNAVENLMARYEFLHSAHMHDECVELFAMQTESSRVEMMWGVYDGPEGIRRCYSGFHAFTSQHRTGQMQLHTLTTQVIEVAEDGRTARGVWVSPGVETAPPPPPPPPGAPYPPPGVPLPPAGDPAFAEFRADWAWCKYGCDFILENGVWKIWHMHVYGLFMAPYHVSWVEGGRVLDRSGMPHMPPKFAPDRPSTTSWVYRSDAVYVNEPAPPAPYRTFADVTDPF
jgi:hypothetical protein